MKYLKVVALVLVAALVVSCAAQLPQKELDYKQTTALVKTLLETATKAKDAAVANVETVKNEAATLVTDVQAAFATVKAESAAAAKDARKAKKAGIDVKAVTAQVAAEETAIATAVAANDAQDYAAARDQLTTLKAEIAQLQASLEAAGFTASL
ncbi:hypothetical protein LWX53_09525 [bacterium]|nr:hypothetical protein [bacterium]